MSSSSRSSSSASFVLRAGFALAVAAPALLIAGCPSFPSDGPDPESTCVTAPSEFDGTDADRLDVGTTTDDVFKPMKDGASVPIVIGPQGGQHFFYTLRAHTGATTLVAKATLRDANGAEVGRAFEYAEPCDQTWREIQNARLFLDSSAAVAGTLTVQLGQCAAETGCTYDEASDSYKIDTILTEKTFQISVVEEP